MLSATPLEDLIERTWRLLQEQHIPLRATYRVQFHPAHFRFEDATRLVPYLERLGISHLYAAPHLSCRPGSSHGYDVVDHHDINAELGTADDLESLHQALAKAGMSMLVDWVPNHMGTGPQNTLWMDLLENGPSSPYSRFFDVDWHPVKPALANRVLVPVLGDHYGAVLERGEVVLGYSQGVFSISYWDHRFPVGPRGYAMILSLGLDQLAGDLGETDPDLEDLQSIITAVNKLPLQTESRPEKLVERRREKEVVKRRLADLAARSGRIREHIEACVRTVNGEPGRPQSFVLMHDLLEMQGYRLAFWRVAAEEINYRRFFDVNELIAIRMEEPEVFEHTHRMLCSWIERGWIQAVRIDHPDGLYDPREYFLRLKAAALAAHCRRRMAEEGARHEPSDPRLNAACVEFVRRQPRSALVPLALFIEKILSREEHLPGSWSVSGTTGYDFLNSVNGLFVDGRSRKALDRAYEAITGAVEPFSEMVHRCKMTILESSLTSEVQVLAHRLDRISEANPHTRDFTLGSLKEALVETIACFPVYRTYVDAAASHVDPRDRSVIESTIVRASARRPATGASVFEFIRSILLNEHPPGVAPSTMNDRRAFLGKFQQVTPPAMAKGIEDTAFYRYHRLVSLNEVGGEPESRPTTVREFHERNQDRLGQRLSSLLATSTHDTKRSEDVRLRIDALSEVAGEWRRLARKWSRMPLDDDASERPDAGDEYLFYQSLLGIWPGGPLATIDRQSLAARLEQYLIKSAREAKLRTTWINPSESYERALVRLVRGVLHRPLRHVFWTGFLPLAERLSWAGRSSSLAQAVIKVASPGVPDIYQGCEGWSLRLVDPDNRAPVDHKGNARALDEIVERCASVGVARAAELLAASPEDGRIKLHVTWRALDPRRRMPELFLSGDYTALQIRGERARHVVAFARSLGRQRVVVVAGRLWLSLARDAWATVDPGRLVLPRETWSDTAVSLPDELGGAYRDVLTGRDFGPASELSLAALLDVLPVAMLECVGGQSAGGGSVGTD